MPVVAPRVGAWIETSYGFESLVNNVSHPVWVRGLKLGETGEGQYRRKSHPVWVRGLKLICLSAVHFFARSHPVWVRGLKPCLVHDDQVGDRVAPRVGAWIETPCPLDSRTPCASHPVWVRGLKQIFH